MELRNIKTFLKIVEQNSFSRAAAAIGYTQSTVTAQIQVLEKELGVSLFDRFNKSIRLTPQGEQFLVYAREIAHTADAAVKCFQETGPLCGTLHIAMAPSICTTFFPDILSLYHKYHPNVQLRVDTLTTDRLFYKLNHNEVDFVYTFDHRIYRREHVIELEHEEPLYFVCHPSHTLCGKTVSLKEVSQYPLILTERDMSYRKDLDQLMAAYSIESRPILELSNAQMLLNLVESNTGISFLPAYVVRDAVMDGKISVLKVSDCNITEWRQVLRHRDKKMTPQMEAMISILKEMCRETFLPDI